MLRNSLDILYKGYYSALAKGDNYLVNEYSSKINNLLVSVGESRIALFRETMKDKPCMKTLSKFELGEEVTDIELAKMISSIITHSLIECEKSGISKLPGLLVSEQSILLANFINGEIDRDDIKRFYREEYRD